jgi:hypothetical protein
MNLKDIEGNELNSSGQLTQQTKKAMTATAARNELNRQ